MGVHVDVAGFARAAEAYERGRPGYPAEVVEWVAKVTGINPFSVVVDVGAGTGKLTRQLVQTGARVVAVEPLAEMRAVLRRSCEGVEVVDGTAAAPGLGRAFADCVTVAQALHWFATPDVFVSLASLLRRDGHLVVLWNRRIADQALQARVLRLLDRYRSPGTAPAGVPDATGDGGWRGLLGACDLFEPVDEAHAYQALTLDRRGIVDHVQSYAFVSTLPEQQQAALRTEAAELVGEVATVELDFTTDAYVFRRRPAAAGR